MSHRLFHDFDVLNQPWSCNPNTFALYHHFVYNAVHKADYYLGIWLEEGQLFFGRNEWCKKTGISEQSLRTSMNSLKSTSHITIKSTNKGSIITLCNHKEKQQWNYKPNQQTNQQTNQQLTSSQPAANQQLTTIIDIYTSDTSDTSDTIKAKKIEKLFPQTLPDFINIELWEGYIEMRKKNKVATTAQAAKLLLKKITDFHDRGFNANQIIEDAIINNWKSFYEPKPQQNNGTNNYGKSKQPYQSIADKITRERGLIED